MTNWIIFLPSFQPTYPHPMNRRFYVIIISMVYQRFSALNASFVVLDLLEFNNLSNHKFVLSRIKSLAFLQSINRHLYRLITFSRFIFDLKNLIYLSSLMDSATFTKALASYLLFISYDVSYTMILSAAALRLNILSFSCSSSLYSN